MTDTVGEATSPIPVEVSVVIACKNEAHRFRGMLESLTRQTSTRPWQVVVADNGSTDRTAEVVQSYAERLPELILVDASAASGYATARNVGVEHSSGAKVLFVDADDEVNDRYVEAMAGALEEAALVCARIGFDRLNPPWVVDVWPARWQQDTPLDDFGFLPFAGGGTLGIRRSLFDEVGGFRQRRAVSQFEEVDLCWRIQLAGYPGPALVPGAILEYRLPTRLSAFFRRGRHYARGQLALRKEYAAQGMPDGRRVLLRDVLGATRRATSRSALCRAAMVLGRFVGQQQGAAGD